jgi:hypothetical protein
MQSILRKREGLPGTANPLFKPGPTPRTSPARSSPTRIRVKDYVSTKRNAGTEGKLGKLVGKTANNMFILEIEGKTYNFFRKDLDITEEPKRVSPKRTNPSRLSPGSASAERIADDFLSGLDTSIADKVINAICRRRTSRVKKSPTRTSPGRKSPAKRRSPTRKTCKSDEEISAKTGRCIKKCADDQERNPATNRCVKRTSKKKASPKIKPILRRTSPKRTSPKKPSPKKPSPQILVSDEDLIVEDYPVRKSPKRVSPKKTEEESGYEFEPLEERVRLRRTSPKFIGGGEEEEEPVTEFITEEVERGPFTEEEGGGAEVSDEDMVVE